MSDTLDATKRIALPTVKVVTVLLAADLFFIISGGQSPAFSSIAELVEIPLRDLGYFAAILSLTTVIGLLPLYFVAAAYNFLAFSILQFPFRRCRKFKLMLKFEYRRKFIDKEKVRSYAQKHKDADLLDAVLEIEKDERSFNSVLPGLILILIISLVLVSSPENPNFLMKVCLNEASASTCPQYKILIGLILFQNFIFATLQGFSMMNNGLMVLDRLPVLRSELLGFPTELEPYDLAKAQTTWMGR